MGNKGDFESEGKLVFFFGEKCNGIWMLFILFSR